jgi:hypothetical protein
LNASEFVFVAGVHRFGWGKIKFESFAPQVENAFVRIAGAITTPQSTIKIVTSDFLVNGHDPGIPEQFYPRDARSKYLDGMFDYVLSTDRAKTFKPDPRAYQLGIDEMKLKRDEILFVAHAGWDACGAKLVGYPTYWVNRQNFPPEEFGPLPDGSGDRLSQLVQFLS